MLSDISYTYTVVRYILHCGLYCCTAVVLRCNLYTIWYIAVVIKSTIEHSPLDENTVLFFENRKPFGKVGFSFFIQNDCECENLEYTSSEESTNILREVCLISWTAITNINTKS